MRGKNKSIAERIRSLRKARFIGGLRSAETSYGLQPSFLDPAVAGEALLIKIMSHAGAVYGSGALSHFADDPDNPDSNGAKTAIRQQIAKARGQLETHFQAKRREWAAGFERLQDWDNADDVVLNQFNAYIWKLMFPAITYDDDRFDRIRTMAVQAVNSAVADYNRQWTEFKRRAVWFGKKERERRGIVFQQVLLIVYGNKRLLQYSQNLFDPTIVNFELGIFNRIIAVAVCLTKPRKLIPIDGPNVSSKPRAILLQQSASGGT